MKKQKRAGWKYPITTYSFSLFAILVMLAVVCPPAAKSQPHLSYIIVLDCGSSGTRIAAYSVQTNATSSLPVLSAISPEAAAKKLPRKVVKSAYNRVETHPGLDTAAARGSAGVKEALGPLLTWAQAAIPGKAHAFTPVMLFATAGVRRMEWGKQEELMRHVRLELDRSPFRFEPSWAGTMSGKWEGIFGWIALNYHHGRFQHPHNTRSHALRASLHHRQHEEPLPAPDASTLPVSGHTWPSRPRHKRALHVSEIFHADSAAPALQSVSVTEPLEAATRNLTLTAPQTAVITEEQGTAGDAIEPLPEPRGSFGASEVVTSDGDESFLRHSRHALSEAPASDSIAPTLGALDMGGSSLEVTMEIPMDEAAVVGRSPAQGVPPLPVMDDSAATRSGRAQETEPDVEDISLPGLRTFRVFSKTMEHMGLNAAYDRAVALLLLEALATHPGTATSPRHRALLHKATDASANPHLEAMDGTWMGNTTADYLHRPASRALPTRPQQIQTPLVAGSSVSSACDPYGDGCGDDAADGTAAGAASVSARRLAQAALRGGTGNVEQVDLHKDRDLVLGHPCLPGGFRQRFSGPLGPAEGQGVKAVILEGRPDSDGCGSLVRRLIASPNVTCPATNACGLVRPPATQGAHFVALSGFFVVFKYFGLLDKGATVRELMEVARQHCGESMDSIVAAKPEETFPETYCFRAHLVKELLQMWQLEPQQVDVEGGDVSWTLGAALHHASQILQGEGQSPEDALDEPQLQRWLSVLSIAALCACIFFLFYEARLFAVGLSYLPRAAQPMDPAPETPISPEVVPQSWPDKAHPLQGKSMPRPASVSCLQARVVSWCDSVSPKYLSRPRLH